jgi:hypothetical protein
MGGINNAMQPILSAAVTGGAFIDITKDSPVRSCLLKYPNSVERPDYLTKRVRIGVLPRQYGHPVPFIRA